MAAVKTLKVGQVKADRELQARTEVNQECAEEYAEAMKEGHVFPPVVVFYDGKTYWLADGFHRLAAAIRAGLDGIQCEVRLGGRRDALLHACGANATHGQPRTNDDKRRAVKLVLADAEWSKMSDCEVARTCAVSRNLVYLMRRDLAGTPYVHPSKRTSTPQADRLKGGSDPAPQPGAAERTEGYEDLEGSSPAEVFRDAVGVPVTDPAMLERFASQAKVKELKSLLRQAQRMVNEICLAPGGEHLMPEVGAKLRKGTEVYYHSHHISQMSRSLDQHMPYCSACPYCHQDHPGRFAKSCKACRGLGYVTKMQWGQCPADYQKAVLDHYGAEAVIVEEGGVEAA